MLVSNKFYTEEVIRAIKGILVNGDMGISFKGVCTDSRTMEPGYLFWALKGKNFDGHTFWKEALNKGAKGLVLDYLPKDMKLEELPKTISIILVKDTLKALGDLAKWYRDREDFKVIAITGSCGKTTTKELTYVLLSNFYKVAKNEGNFNNLIGVPLTLLGIKKKPEWVILELGTNTSGEIARLAEIVNPLISIITNILPAHLEGLKSLEGVLEEKIALFRYTQGHGFLIYYFDNLLLRERVRNFPQKKVSFGKEVGADLRLKTYHIIGEEIEAEIEYEGQGYKFKTKVSGEHNLLNLLGAISIALTTGLTLDEILKRLPQELNPYIRSKIHRLKELVIIDDSYNANPGSMERALLWLKDHFNLKPKLTILGDMKELGVESERYHREIGELAGKIVDKAIFIGDMAPFYVEGFKLSGKPFESYKSVEAFIESGAFREFKDTKGVLLIKGSRAVGMERIVKKILEEDK